MTSHIQRRVERLEAVMTPQNMNWLVVAAEVDIPAGFNGRATVTGVPRASSP